MVLMKERIGKLISCVKELIYSSQIPANEYKMIKTEHRFSDIRAIDTSHWDKLDKNGIWGGHREFYYFAVSFSIPNEWAGKSVVYELRTGREGQWDAVNPQFLAYVNGEAKQGLDVNHREILLTNNAVAGEKFDIVLSAFTGDNNYALLLDSEFKVLERETEKYYYDLVVPYDVARLLKKDSDEFIAIIKSLNESLNKLDLRTVYSDDFYKSLKEAQDYLTENFYKKRCGSSPQTIYCVGHTHIDIAWMWTLKTTEDKAVRSFSSVLELMDQYPEYKFMSSQPQLYKYVKKNAPEIYDKIRQRVAEGRWETEGGMWVEADCNIASGEALVRQFVYGIHFFRTEFGKDNKLLWLPDVFGYSAALPQIMKKCGLDYFMTTKISWNEFNKIPYDTFMWEGIDGTEVLTHFIPTRDYGAGAKEDSSETEHFTTYNGILNPSQAKGSWQRYSQKDLNNEVLMCYGYGDGGGGPTKEMLENQRRLEQGIPGSPVTKQSHVLEFFQLLDSKVQGSKYLPRWVGELYLEYHRGTYTSMARNKRDNRKSEFACQNLELYRIMAKSTLGMDYPKEKLDEAWEILLRNQFHDILPGSSIKEVYEDSDAEYKELFAMCDELKNEALLQMASEINGSKGDIIVFNPNSVSVTAPVLLPIEANNGLALTDGENKYLMQTVEGGMLAVIKPEATKGYKSYKLAQADLSENLLSVSTTEVDTPYFNVRINENGQFTSIYDKKASREIIPQNKLANVIVSYEDIPHNFDAWDINNYYTEKSWTVDDVSSIEVIEEGPVRGCIKIKRPYLSSVITQYIYFYSQLYRIDIRNEIDWKEKQILLRDYFPVDIHTSQATYEIQYGNVKRPTHYNTSWDFARFEVCAHKWLDVSEDGYGISVINDCKYGYSVHDGVIGLSMLKSAVYPNPDADKEHHSFSYSICPHVGSLREGEVVQNAYVFNNTYVPVIKDNCGGSLPAEYSFVKCDSENVIVEVVKKAEKTDEIVIRLYECYNHRSKATLDIDGEIVKACECNMLEENDEPIEFCGNKINFTIRPYEIKTLKITKK